MNLLADINWQAVESIATVIAALLALSALIQALQINKKQQELTREIHSQQMLLTQRQVFVQMFDQIKNLRTINPEEPVWAHVTEAVNILDFIGICWESELVDQKIILRLYREIFIDTYEQIQKCSNPPSDKVLKDGRSLLRDSRSATNLYNHLVKDHVDRDLSRPLIS